MRIVLFIFSLLLFQSVFASDSEIELICYKNRLFQLALIKQTSELLLSISSNELTIDEVSIDQEMLFDLKSKVISYYDDLDNREKSSDEFIAETSKIKYQELYKLDLEIIENDYRAGVYTFREYTIRKIKLGISILSYTTILDGENVAHSKKYIYLFFIVFFLIIIIVSVYYMKSSKKGVPKVQDCPSCLRKKTVDTMLVGSDYYRICKYCSFREKLPK